MLNLIDSKTHDPVILAEQCLALTCAMINSTDAPVKESLQFILHEKMEALLSSLSG